jgi:hypothetical protein
MGDWAWAGKLASDFGVLGVLVFFGVLLYRLMDKWAARFLDAHVGQATALAAQATSMTALTKLVESSQTIQADMLVALGVMADRVERQRGYLEAIDKTCRERGGCAA